MKHKLTPRRWSRGDYSYRRWQDQKGMVHLRVYRWNYVRRKNDLLGDYCFYNWKQAKHFIENQQSKNYEIQEPS